MCLFIQFASLTYITTELEVIKKYIMMYSETITIGENT